METKSGPLTGAEFFEKLQQDKLENPSPSFLIGMVKKSDGKEKTVEFAPGGNCSTWVTIPLEFIDTAEVIKTVPCKDHFHPLVRLNLKTPKTPEGKILFALLGGMKQSSEGAPYRYETPEMEFPSPNMPMTSAQRRVGGFGGFGGGLGNLWGDCQVLEYQCHCVEWEKVNFGVWRCIKEDCAFVCTKRP